MYLYIALFYDVDQMAAHTANDYEFGTPVIQVQIKNVSTADFKTIGPSQLCLFMSDQASISDM